MFSSNILDIVVTLGFTFLLLALIVSTVTEIINTVMQKRSVYLQRGLIALFVNISEKKDNRIFKSVMDSPFIKLFHSEPGWTVKLLASLKLFKLEDAKFPSYIAPNTLSLAVIDVLEIKNLDTINYYNVKKQIEKKLGPHGDDNNAGEREIKNLLLTILDNSVDKDGKFLLTNFTAGIEKIFNDSMNRVTGLYKRKSQWISFIISVIVVLLINVDTIRIVKTLQTDKDLLENAVTIATNTYSRYNPADTINKESMNDDTTSLAVSSGDTSDVIIAIEKKKNDINVIINKLNETKIPIGWSSTLPGWGEFWGVFWISILGWLISIIAVYLGAPFWFDVLNKFTNIRGAGVKPPDTTSEVLKEGDKK